jgi:hypothetical protein
MQEKSLFIKDQEATSNLKLSPIHLVSQMAFHSETF